MKKDFGTRLSRNEMKTIKGALKGSCSESCGSGANIVSCSSASGDCSRDDVEGYIKCDGKKYNCPGRQ
jgi:hypothetical protein